MKRRIFAMGALKPARIVPEHNTFEPTIRLPALKSLIAYCDKFHNTILATEIINVIISDINSDIQVEEVSNTSIYEYYMDYYKHCLSRIKHRTQRTLYINVIELT